MLPSIIDAIGSSKWGIAEHSIPGRVGKTDHFSVLVV